ncbi:MAG: nuclear transport factor 2 family protein [Chitinophagales bacterium]|nr:nuclear transport factor 2 family protein [Chitinophagales bacterium]
MENKEIIENLIQHCRNGAWNEAQDELFAQDAISVELAENGTTKGLESIKKKADWFAENFEVHSIQVSDPLIAGDTFAIRISLDTTNKKDGKRTPMDELCVYEIRNGKIISERFF